MLGSFPPELSGRLAATSLLRSREPTLSCNHSSQSYRDERVFICSLGFGLWKGFVGAGSGPASSPNRDQPVWPFRCHFPGQLDLYFGAFLCPYVHVFHKKASFKPKRAGAHDRPLLLILLILWRRGRPLHTASLSKGACGYGHRRDSGYEPGLIIDELRRAIHGRRAVTLLDPIPGDHGFVQLTLNEHSEDTKREHSQQLLNNLPVALMAYGHADHHD